MTTDNISIFPHAFKREQKIIFTEIKIANKICIKKYWYKGDERNDNEKK